MGSDTAAGAALLDWIKLFPIDADVATVNELGDGTIICKLLLDIDYDAFYDDLNKIAPSTQWVVRFQNLKKIYKALNHYFSATLGVHPPKTSKYQPDLLPIAREGSPSELVKLMKMVVFVAVQSERREHYITKIQKLNSTSQTELMLIINQFMSSASTAGSGGGGTGEEGDEQRNPYTSETEFQLEEEISRLFTEKEATDNENKQLVERLTRSNAANEDLRAEIQNLQDRLTERAASSTGQSKADTVLQIQLDQLQADVHKLEDTVADRDNSISTHEITIKNLNRKVDDLTRISDQVERLKDELDTSKHTIEKLRKEQNVMQHYKKKLEGMPELEKRLKYLEEENATIQRENVQMEEAIRGNTGDKKLIGTYKKQVERFETEHAELLKEKQKLEVEVTALREKSSGAESQRAKDTDLIQNLEVKVRELENGLMGQVSESIQGDLDSEMNFKGVTKTDLKLRINKLERENQALKDSGVASADAGVLQSILQDKENARLRLEQDVLAMNGDKLALEAELVAFRSGATIDEGSAIVQRLRKNIEERDRIIQETRKQLDDRPPLAVTTGDASINKLLHEKDDLQKQIADLKDSLLDSEKANGELKASLAAIGGSTEGRQGELEKRVLQLQDKLEDRREKSIKSREHIKKQNSTIQSLEEALEAAKSAGMSQKQKDELEAVAAKNEILTKELDLMTSAWYDITTRLQSNSVILGRRKDAPVSWLGKQRVAVAGFQKR